MANDSKKRCNVHSEKKFVLAKEIKVANNFKCVLAVMWAYILIYSANK